MKRKPFSIFGQKLSPRMIVEASAGTGKTYSIVGLFIRLLVEKNVDIDQILVVTFTRMATKELKDRILSRLRTALKVVTAETYEGEDPFLNDLIDFCKDHPEASENLQNAIRNFDDAQVHTIHGFCQKVLKEEALISGMPFELEVQQTDRILNESVRDFWREFMYQHSQTRAGEYYISKVMGFVTSPDKLLNTLRPLLDTPGAIVEPEPDIEPVSMLDELLALREELIEVWKQDQETIKHELIQSDISGLTENKVSQFAGELREFLEDERFECDAPKNLEKLTSTYLQDDSNLNSGGTQKPGHPFFELCDRYYNLVLRLPDVKTAFLWHAGDEVNRRRDRKSHYSAELTFDDLLKRLDESLNREGTGRKLASRLRKKYPFALVDEFQDTDPLQYQIFDRIYPLEKSRSCLMMIGDPKQAIYAFRGADVYAYLRARKSVDERSQFTLNDNYRSSKRLIEGVNSLFSKDDYSFVEKEIGFNKAGKGLKPKEKELTSKGNKRESLHIYYTDGIVNTSDARAFGFGQTVRQIVKMISEGNRRELKIGDDPLEAGDIAVLVSSNRDAETIKKMLKERGVDSVTYSREKVFESREANRLDRLMAAILEPGNDRVARTALLTGFFGSEIHQLHERQLDEERYSGYIDLLYELNDHWQKNGFYPAFRKLLFEHESLENIAGFYNSERILTNLFQLAELSAYTEQEHGLDPAGLHRWFRNRMSETGEDEEQTLRLESDRNLVKISTIHSSKGLEFPVVFCPTLWYSRDWNRNKPAIEEFHDAKKDHKTVLNLDQSDSERRNHAIYRSRMEEIAENVRTAYVALTRARYECRVMWASTRNTHFSGLAATLLDKEKIEKAVRSNVKMKKAEGIDPSLFRKIFEELAEEHPESIRFTDQPEEPIQLTPFTEQPDRQGSWNTCPHALTSRLLSDKQMYSFSSLVHHEAEAVTEPDYDQWLEDYSDTYSGEKAKTDYSSIFQFPRGARAGTLIHKLFEHPDFDFRDPDKSNEWVGEILEEYGFDPKWKQCLTSMMGRVARGEYTDLKLNKVRKADLLKEMEFHFPTGRPDSDSILKLIRAEPVNTTVKDHIQGFMTGFIDLIVRQNDRYFILDYKSNHLGDSVEDYRHENLRKEIHSAGYDVQYHLYTLALKKYLESRVGKFDYQKDFGGVFYLFVRGMESGSSNGIYRHKPEIETIVKLEKLLKRHD